MLSVKLFVTFYVGNCFLILSATDENHSGLRSSLTSKGLDYGKLKFQILKHGIIQF